MDTAREILRNIDSVVPGVVLTRLWRIGLEMREKKYDQAEALYLESVSRAQSSEARNFYAGRYAGFAVKVSVLYTLAVSSSLVYCCTAGGDGNSMD